MNINNFAYFKTKTPSRVKPSTNKRNGIFDNIKDLFTRRKEIKYKLLFSERNETKKNEQSVFVKIINV